MKDKFKLAKGGVSKGGEPGLFETVIQAVVKTGDPEKFSSFRNQVANRVLGNKTDLESEVFLSTKQQQLKNCDDTMRRRRDGMGHYQYSAERGEIPLTCRELPTPGPGEYEPDYTKNSTVKHEPEYSIRPWTKPNEKKVKTPGPKYQVNKGFLRKKQNQVSIKSRNRPPDEKSGVVGPGPAVYKVTTDTVGTHPDHKKVTLKSKINSQARGGLQNNALLLPTESPGFLNTEEMFKLDKTNTSVAMGDAPQWSFSGGHRDYSHRPGPGPAVYKRPADYHNIPDPGKSITGRNYAEAELPNVTPGPAGYKPSQYDKSRNPCALVLPKRELDEGNHAPAPNEYLIRGAYDKFKRSYDMRGPHITFRDHYDPHYEVLPGPSDYPEKHDVKVPGGTFSTSDRGKTTFPDCLNYKSDLKTSKRVPGASIYYPTNHCIGNNSKPKHSFTTSKQKSNDRDEETVGPGDYNTRGMTHKGISSAPRYSFRTATSPPRDMKRNQIPAPADYNTTPPNDGKAYTMVGRNNKPNKCTRRAKKTERTPGPHYNLRGLTSKGPTQTKSGRVTMKSRPSPHIYQGVDGNRINLLSSTCAPRRWNDSIHF